MITITQVKEHVKKHYPEAVFEGIDGKPELAFYIHGETEVHFYPSATCNARELGDCYCAYTKNGKIIITDDF